jgi:iron complex outermembrane receptor protein
MASCRDWRWLALCALHNCLICALFMGAGSRFAIAQAVTELRGAIPPAPLSVALRDFSRQTAIQVMYLSALAEGRNSKGAAAGLSTRDALASLLDGTGLRYEFLNARSLRLLAVRSPSVDTTSGAERRPTMNPLTAPALEEVIVSATKRDEPLHDVAMSALVLSGQELDAAGITTLSDIAARTPGMQFDLGSQFGSGIMSNLVIRGISADRGTAPTIGMYIDDVPIQAVRISLYKTQPLTFDLARVEVLRGPQGTLFGSNAVAGAIRYVSNEASTTESSQWYRAELSDTDHGGLGTEVSGVVDGPLQPGLLGARASVWVRRDGGYVDRINPLNGVTLDAHANRSDSRVLRLGMVWTPDERVKVTPSWHYQSLLLHDTPMFFTTTPGSLPASPFSASLLQNGKLVRQPYDDRFSIGSVKVQWDLNVMNFTAVSALFDRNASTVVDQTNEACLYDIDCGNPLGRAYPSSYAQAIFDYLHIHQGAFSQELRLSSDAGNARFSWLAGLFYYRAYTHRYDDAFFDAFTPQRYDRSDSFVSSSYLDGFATVAYALTTRWRIGAGTRFGWAAGSFSSYDTDYLSGSSSSSTSSGPTQAVPTNPRFELTYRPSERNFYYASAARGSRPGGGGETRQCNGIPLPERLDPDVLWSYELGSKNILFDGRLQLDASVYDVHWRDLHVHVSDACDNGYVLNGGLAVSRGFDLTGEWHTDRLAVRLALGYVDIRYRETVFNETGQVVAQRGAVVGGLPEVPAPWNGSLSVQYRRPLGSGYLASLRAEGLFTSRNTGPFMQNNPYAAYFVADSAQADSATSRVNLSAGVIRNSMEYRIGLDNALNSRPSLHATSDGASSSLSYAYTFPPRTLQASVARRL